MGGQGADDVGAVAAAEIAYGGEVLDEEDIGELGARVYTPS
jgi:hypothetical protein